MTDMNEVILKADRRGRLCYTPKQKHGALIEAYEGQRAERTALRRDAWRQPPDASAQQSTSGIFARDPAALASILPGSRWSGGRRDGF
jgi:hypothetical protein